MSNFESGMQLVTDLIEKYVETMYEIRFNNTPKPPPIDSFKASALAEIARRVRARAVKIEEDWEHSTRD